jgi:DNA-directed RNA polymerase
MPPVPEREAQLEAQARFEVEAFDEGTERYREAIAARDLSELTVGQKLLREIVKPFAAAIAKSRAEAADSVTRHGGEKLLWALPIQLVEEDDRLAVITVGCVLAMHRFEHEDDAIRLSAHSLPVTSMARNIASATRMQVEYDKWAQGNDALDRKLRAKFPTLHRNVWRRWRTKVNALREEPWPPAVEVTLGATLIHLLVQSAPTRFRIETQSVRGKPTVHLVISDETIELLNDVTTRMEVARPLLMPMICEPLDWRYEE